MAWRLSCTLLAVGLTLLAAACSSGAATIDFSQVEEQPTAQAAVPSGNTIRMAVAPVLSPLPTFTLYQQLADYMGDKLGRPVELVQGKTYAEINDLVKSGDVALALVCTNPYLQGQQDFGMELLVAPLVQGEPYYYSLLIVGRDLDASSLEELRGTTFAFSDPLSNTGRLAPLYQLALRGETPESFFSRSIFTYSHDNSIRAVADGIVDGAAVDSLVYDYLRVSEPDTMAKVKVIEKWGPFGINPVVVNPGLDPQLKAQCRDVFLNMDKDSRGRELLAQFRIDRFIVPDDSIYDSVREMRSYLQERGLGQ
jgi:phosphonate transport system substrate-binding protein